MELDGRKMVRIVHTNTHPGVAVRQMNYILDMAGRRYFVTCTTLEADESEYAVRFEAFVKSLAKP